MEKGAYHNDTPEDDDTDDVHRGRRRGQGLGESGKDDHDELETVHALATNDIGKSTEAELADDGTSRGGELDGSIRRGGHLADAGVVDNAEHECQKRDGEDVVRVGKETDTGNHDGTDMVPAEGGPVDLGEGKTAALVDILDVDEVVVLR